MEDVEIQQEVWAGAIPVEFVLPETEVAGVDHKMPLYKLVPRVALIPFYIEEIISHFQLDPKADMWLSYRGSPVPWHLPIGVIFDMVSHNDAEKGIDAQLPFQLHVSTKSFPEECLLRIKSLDEAKSLFMHSWKQALYVMFGTTKFFANMPPADVYAFRDAVSNGTYSTYSGVRNKMFKSQGTPSAFIVALYVCSAREPLQGFKCYLRDAKAGQTFAAFMHSVFPDWFPATQAHTVLKGSTERPARVHLHGVQPLDTTPMDWIAMNCSFADSVVHLVVVDESK